jgi:nicotinamidase/pyrazinamidase
MSVREGAQGRLAVTVFVDVDSQLDFMMPAGALYVSGAEHIIDRMASLNRHAAAQGFKVISTVDAHSEDDPEFKSWPHHCVAGTLGQQKCSVTLLERRVVVPNAPCELTIDGAQQIIVEKQTIDAFTNQHLATILATLGADRCVVYGVVTEICVWQAAMGLIKTGARVEIVTDAIRSLSDAASAKALAEFTAAGCTLTTIAHVLQE